MHSKEVLSEFIYKLNEKNVFLRESTSFSSSVVGFAYNNSLPRFFLREIKDKN